jgi:hypothetical protein
VSARFLLWFWGILAIVWFVATIVIPFTSLAKSTAYVSFVSNLALALACGAAWQAAHGERKQEKDK